MIREFAAMLSELKPGKLWKSREFFGYTSETPDCVPLSVAGTDGIALTIFTSCKLSLKMSSKNPRLHRRYSVGRYIAPSPRAT